MSSEPTTRMIPLDTIAGSRENVYDPIVSLSNFDPAFIRDSVQLLEGGLGKDIGEPLRTRPL